MYIVISYSREDQGTADKISAYLAAGHVTCRPDERRDWLYHGLRRIPDEATHLVLVLSEFTENTWWVPFLNGRAETAGLPVIVYCQPNTVPVFLRNRPQVSSLAELQKILHARNWSASQQSPD